MLSYNFYGTEHSAMTHLSLRVAHFYLATYILELVESIQTATGMRSLMVGLWL